jgi:hypothetical protein
MSGSAPGKRTITIDSSLQAFPKRSGKNKHKSAKNNSAEEMKPKLKPNQFIRPSTLKRKLLARIKNHQKKHAQPSSAERSLISQEQPAAKVHSRAVSAAAAPAVVTPPTSAAATIQTQNETFAQSLEYLQSLAANKRENRHTNIKQPNTSNTPHNKTQKTRTNHNNHAPTAVVTPFGNDTGLGESHPQVFLDAFPTTQSTQSNNNSNVASPMLSSTTPLLPLAPPPPLPSPSSIFQSSPQQSPFQEHAPIILNQEPRWGCLKSGSKPTFRTFHNKTLKNNSPVSVNASPISTTSDIAPIVMAVNTVVGIDSDSSEIHADAIEAADSDAADSDAGTSEAVTVSEALYGTRQQRLDEYRREQIKAEKKTVEPTVKIKQTKQRVITKKYKLGKYNNATGPVIGVLIKNVQTQRNVERKRNELRRVPLDTVITRLHKKRLLKVGSTAPPDILREMYESAVLAGDIENEGNDIALHNFLSGDDTTDANH